MGEKKKVTTREKYSAEVNRIVDEMSLMDDDLMSRVFENNIPATELLLETILGEEVTVAESVGQMELKNPIVGGRNITLDIYATDSKGRKFNCEVQRRNSGADPRRVRFHSSMIDTRVLREAEEFTDIKDTYVIFITKDDYYGYGRAFYHVERKVDIGESDLPFNDGNHIIYVNAGYAADDELGRLMADFRNRTTEGFYNPEIEKAVKHYKEDEGGRQNMCEAVERYAEERGKVQYDIGVNYGREEGRKEGRKEGQIDGQLESIRKMMKNLKLTAEQAMESLEIPVSEQSKFMAML